MSLTLVLIIACVGASLLGWQNPNLILRYGLHRGAVLEQGEWYRLLTHAFFHGDLWHLLLNSFVFYSFGSHLEPLLGRGSYAILLILGLLGSAFMSMGMRPRGRDVIGIGFSGVVSAVVFAMIIYYPGMRLLVFFVPMPAWLFGILYVAYSVYAGQSGSDGIDHWAHLGGAAVGVIFALLV